MKTLLFTMEYPPFKGGVANYYHNLERNWPEADGFKVLFKKYPPSPFQYLLYWQDLYRAVKVAKIDYILAGQILPVGTVVYLFSRIFHKPYAVVLHGMDFPLALVNVRKRFLTRIILGRASKIFCSNSYVAKLVRDFSLDLGKKAVVVNPGASEPLAVDPKRIEDLKRRYNLVGRKVIMTIGRLVKRKGVDTMLSALEFLGREKTNDWRYVVLGAGPDEEYLKNICRQKGLTASVIFAGAVSEEDKWAWLNLCDLFAMPTRNMAGDFEGFGIVYLEANLAGKPVLATGSGGVADAVLNGTNGFLVNSDRIEDLASNLEKLMNNQDLRNYLGQKGRFRVETEFDWKTQAKKIYLEINS